MTEPSEDSQHCPLLAGTGAIQRPRRCVVLQASHVRPVIAGPAQVPGQPLYYVVEPEDIEYCALPTGPGAAWRSCCCVVVVLSAGLLNLCWSLLHLGLRAGRSALSTPAQ